jgi:hypothetical protein
MTRKIVSASILDDDDDEMVITFSDGYKQSETLFYPDGEGAQLDCGVTGHTTDKDEWDIITKELTRFSIEVLGITERKSYDKLASDWVSKNIVLSEHCEIEYQDVVKSLTNLLKDVAN